MKILVTGGSGFIGSALIRKIISETSHQVLNVDALTYAASEASLAGVEGSDRYGFSHTNICDREAIQGLFRQFRPDTVMHLAAETHEVVGFGWTGWRPC